MNSADVAASDGLGTACVARHGGPDDQTDDIPEVVSAAIDFGRTAVGVDRSPSATAWGPAGETILVVTDEPLRQIGYALHQAAKTLGHDVVLVEILPRRATARSRRRRSPI